MSADPVAGRAQGRADGRIEGQAEGRADGRIEGQAEGQADGRIEGHAEGRAEGQADGRIEGHAEGRAEGRADGRALDRATHRTAGAAADPGASPAADASLARAAAPNSSPVLDIRDLSVVYRTPGGDVRAVDHVNLALAAGEVVGLAGESGSGKSTLAYGACRLLRAPALVTNGNVTYHGRRASKPADLLKMRPDELRRLRWREIAIVFQSAMNALNPVLNVRDQLLDVIHAHLKIPRDEAREKAGSLLDLVGIPRSRLRSYPHELSGGMRQRVMIAMALATDPEIIIMDEPTTALDVVVQRDILAQIVELKDRLGFSILFITHDLSLLLELADRIAVMYAGRFVEIATSDEIHREAAHPYTKGLLNSFPSLRGPRRELAGIPGSPPDLRNPAPGCPFVPRCGYARPECRDVDMGLLPVVTSGDPDHVTACPFVLPETPVKPAPSVASGSPAEELGT